MWFLLLLVGFLLVFTVALVGILADRARDPAWQLRHVKLPPTGSHDVLVSHWEAPGMAREVPAH